MFRPASLLQRYRLSLWLQITLILGVASLILGYMSAEFVRQQETPYLLENLRKQGEQTITLLSASSLEAVISEDIPALDTLTEHAGKQNPEIVSIAIVNRDGLLLSRWDEQGSAGSPQHTITLDEEIILEGEQFGAIRLVWSTESRLTQINKHALSIRNSIFLLVTAIGVVIIGLIFLMVIRPINQINRSLVELRQSGRATKARDFSYSSTELKNLNQTVISLDQAWAELQIAKVAADQANVAKTQFIANMSHELRTPLNIIMGMSELAMIGDLPERERDLIGRVMKSGQSLHRLIEGMIDFSNLDAGQLPLQRDRLRMGEVVEPVQQELLEQIEQKGLTFSFEQSPEVPDAFEGDGKYLRKILYHLIDNAIKFNREGGLINLRVSIAGGTKDCTQQMLQFAIMDTGIGIGPEEQTQLFQPFHQLDGSATRHHEGIGLGLELCRRLVEEMGGRIWLESEPGTGSTFFFTVEAGCAEVAEAAAPAVGESQSLSSGQTPRNAEEMRPVSDEQRAQAEPLIQELQVLLADYDATSEEPVAPLIELFRGTALEADLMQIQRSVRAYAFDRANAELTALIEQLESYSGLPQR